MKLSIRKECCCYITTILLILIIAIIIKISFPNLIENLDYTFNIEFKADSTEIDTNALQFQFSTDGNTGTGAKVSANANVVKFDDRTKPASDFYIIITTTKETDKDKLQDLFYSSNNSSKKRVKSISNGISLQLSSNVTSVSLSDSS